MVAIVALAFAAAAPTGGRIPVILTTDCGVEADDQWAVAHLARSPRIDLLAVVTTHAPSLAPPAAETSAKAVREWLGVLDPKAKPEVLPGSNVPLDDRARPLRNAGVDLILKAARGGTAEHRVTVLVIGAATDVASALLVDPTLADRVELVAMGFTRWPEGGDPWNVKNDIRAWQVLLDSRAPLVVGDEAVCVKHLALSADDARRRLEGTGAPGRKLVATLESWLAAHPKLSEEKTGTPTKWPIWDEVTVAHLLGLTTSETLPRPALRDDLTFDHSRPRGTITWVRSVRSDALWSDLADCLRNRP